MVKEKEKVYTYITTEINKKMDMEYTHTKMAIYMKVIIKKEIMKAKEYINITMEKYMKVNIKMI